VNKPTAFFIPPGKIRCYITGKLRKETPEEHVRQRIARSLVEEYGYPKEDIGIERRETCIVMGRAKKYADLIVFAHGKEHKQENAIIVCETKREDVKPTDRENGVNQLKSYLAACVNARFGLWVGSELQLWEKVVEEGEVRFEEAADLPAFGIKEPPRLTFKDLIPAHEGLRDIFKRCHNYIYGNQGLPKDQAFHELLKLIFCKVHDERETHKELIFSITNEERRSTLGQRRLRERIDQLFEEVKQKYRYIFAKDEKIRLENRVLAYIVAELQRYSLLRTDADVKGAAYEEIVGANLRGDRGEFFTPRNVCRMAVEMVFATYPKERWLHLKVLDPACGTGGFLIATMNLLKGIINEQEQDRWGLGDRARHEAERRLKEICDSNLFGIDLNPMLVRAAQMNLVMHGDGSSNVFQANSLLPPGEWPNEPPNNVRDKIQLGSFDIVFTNPPFGSRIPIDDPHVLDQFELARFEATQLRSSMPPEQLFIERCWQFLKPGGRLAIVLPDSILSNPGLAFIRRWIFKRCRVIASIDLPSETFEPFTGTKTSILILQKKSEGQMKLEEASGRIEDYQVFMAIPEAVGHDRRGQPVYLRTPEGEIIWQEETVAVVTREPMGLTVLEPKKELRPIIDDDLPQVSELFKRWVRERNLMGWFNAD
jgi:type I restriction enzyme M protein